jgi:superfamily II DNA/RNA helicase
MRDRLVTQGVKELFPVQTSTFSLFAHHENELIVKSRTGTGKTLSFLLPLEFLLKYNKDGTPAASKKSQIRAIILEPTRELAT